MKSKRSRRYFLEYNDAIGSWTVVTKMKTAKGADGYIMPISRPFLDKQAAKDFAYMMNWARKRRMKAHDKKGGARA